MKRADLQDMAVNDLVGRFVAIALEQDQALLANDTAKFNPLYWAMDAVAIELKSRPGDQRHALLRLYDHPNAQVRLKAAKSTLAIAPEAARGILQAVSDSAECPQAGEAGMSLINLDRGIFKPT
jgi:hypothetical protein